MSREMKISWAAGFFDGEGCISILRTKRRDNVYHSLSISAFQNIRPPLETLVSLFDGNISVRPDQGWIWTAYGKTASVALMQMLPFLQVKNLQAAAAIVFQDRKLVKGQKYSDAHSRTTLMELDAEDWRTIRDLKVVV